MSVYHKNRDVELKSPGLQNKIIFQRKYFIGGPLGKEFQAAGHYLSGHYSRT